MNVFINNSKKSVQFHKQCKKIGDMSYMIDWHRLPGKKGLAVVLLTAMSNLSVKLTVANLLELSLNTFGDVSNYYNASH